MRPVPLIALVALSAGACSTTSDRTQQTAFQVPTRDLTLQQAEVPAVDVASPVELNRAPAERAARHQPQRAHKPAPSRRPAARKPAEPVPVPTVATTAAPASHVALTAAHESETPDPHALAPGQTVTVLPASSGGGGAAPAAPAPGDDWPSDPRGTWIDGGSGGAGWGGGSGGSCGGRGGGMHPGSGGTWIDGGSGGAGWGGSRGFR